MSVLLKRKMDLVNPSHTINQVLSFRENRPYIKNNKGPNTDPFGTPFKTGICTFCQSAMVSVRSVSQPLYLYVLLLLSMLGRRVGVMPILPVSLYIPKIMIMPPAS